MIACLVLSVAVTGPAFAEAVVHEVGVVAGAAVPDVDLTSAPGEKQRSVGPIGGFRLARSTGDAWSLFGDVTFAGTDSALISAGFGRRWNLAGDRRLRWEVRAEQWLSKLPEFGDHAVTNVHALAGYSWTFGRRP